MVRNSIFPLFKVKNDFHLHRWMIHHCNSLSLLSLFLCLSVSVSLCTTHFRYYSVCVCFAIIYYQPPVIAPTVTDTLVTSLLPTIFTFIEFLHQYLVLFYNSFHTRWARPSLGSRLIIWYIVFNFLPLSAALCSSNLISGHIMIFFFQKSKY